MESKIIREEDLVENDYGATKITTIFSSEEWPFDVAKVRKVGDDIHTGYDTESNVIYYVLEGQGISVLNGKEYRVKKGDCIVSPKGTKYKNLKGLTLLAISFPRFDRSRRVYTD